MADTAPTYDEKREKVRTLVNDIGQGFMVTVGDGGQLHGRPMANAEVKPGADVIYFSSHKQSGKTSELADDSHVFLGYAKGTGRAWVSLSGTARVVNDRAKIRELWSPQWKNWFDGPDDPNLVLIEVRPTMAEYWDSGSVAVEFARQAVAMVTGKKMGDGENEKVRM